MKTVVEPNIILPIRLEQWREMMHSVLELFERESLLFIRGKFLEIMQILKIASTDNPDAPLYFTNEAWSMLKDIHKNLLPEQMEGCKEFMKGYKYIEKWMQPSHFFDIPLEIHRASAQNLNYSSIRALRHTCSFFYNDNVLKGWQKKLLL